jgi:hypothetical protein
MQTNLVETLTRLVPEGGAVTVRTRLEAGPAQLGQKASKLEREAYNAAVREVRQTKGNFRAVYAGIMRGVGAFLRCQVGPFPEDVVAFQLCLGVMPAEVLVAASLQPPPEPDPRETIRRLFVQTLMAADSRYAEDKELALETARELEVSCYNAAVRTSKQSEDPPRRQWDSAAFVDIYSTRCGTINVLLDVTSTPCRTYGAVLVPRLLAGEVAPGVVGDLTEKFLCPKAVEVERAEIARRAVQKVEEKESSLFRCPHCGERRCVYRETQRRSLDEAPDYLCLCLSCNRRFTGRS